MVFSFIFSVRPISRRNIAIKIISSIQSEGIKRYSFVARQKERNVRRLKRKGKLHFVVCGRLGREDV